MIKKITVASMLFATLFAANAQEKSSSSSSSGNKMIKKGFYLNLGLAFPSATFTPEALVSASASSTGSTSSTAATGGSYSQSFGLQPHLEIGNQWYFWKNQKMGVGLRVSWLQLGYGSGNTDLGTEILKTGAFDMRLLKLAPQFTYAFNEKMALDFSIEIAPTILIGGRTSEDKVTGTLSSANAFATAGLLFAPGVKFRYNIFAAGFDFNFGGMTFASVGGGASTTGTTTSANASAAAGTASFAYPRFYLGFKF